MEGAIINSTGRMNNPIAHPPRGTPPAPSWPAPPRAGRRWPAIAAAATIAAVIAAGGAIVATRIAAQHDSQPAHVAATVTVTVPPRAAPTPVPLPTAEADRQTCNAWLAAGKHVDVAVAALRRLPAGMTVLDPAIRDNQGLSALLRTAADAYEQAGNTLSAGITPGTTVILNQSATAAAAALHAVHTAESTYDAANGNTFHVWQEAASTVNVLCERLAP